MKMEKMKRIFMILMILVFLNGCGSNTVNTVVTGKIQSAVPEKKVQSLVENKENEEIEETTELDKTQSDTEEEVMTDLSKYPIVESDENSYWLVRTDNTRIEIPINSDGFRALTGTSVTREQEWADLELNNYGVEFSSVVDITGYEKAEASYPYYKGTYTAVSGKTYYIDLENTHGTWSAEFLESRSYLVPVVVVNYDNNEICSSIREASGSLGYSETTYFQDDGITVKKKIYSVNGDITLDTSGDETIQYLNTNTYIRNQNGIWEVEVSDYSIWELKGEYSSVNVYYDESGNLQEFKVTGLIEDIYYSVEKGGWYDPRASVRKNVKSGNYLFSFEEAREYDLHNYEFLVNLAKDLIDKYGYDEKPSLTLTEMPDNRDVWERELLFNSGVYGISFSDLNRDGHLELLYVIGEVYGEIFRISLEYINIIQKTESSIMSIAYNNLDNFDISLLDLTSYDRNSTVEIQLYECDGRIHSSFWKERTENKDRVKNTSWQFDYGAWKAPNEWYLTGASLAELNTYSSYADFNYGEDGMVEYERANVFYQNANEDETVLYRKNSGLGDVTDQYASYEEAHAELLNLAGKEGFHNNQVIQNPLILLTISGNTTADSLQLDYQSAFSDEWIEYVINQ